MEPQGLCDDRFTAVGDEFVRNFAERGEVGATVAVFVGGELVVDLWGGTLDQEGTRPWERDTLCVIMSCTKGITALCAHLLASVRELDFDATVATYWPEFATNGKEKVLVRHLLNHQAGLPGLRDWLPDGAFYDWDGMVERLAAEAPMWEPGTRHGYHGMTFGFLVGEVVRRVAGMGIGDFVAKEIAGPLGLDLHLGLPEPEHARVSPFHPPTPPPDGAPLSRYHQTMMSDPTSPAFLMTANTGGYLLPGAWDAPPALSAVLPSTGCVSNARNVAAVYNAVVHDRKVGRFELAADDLVRMGAAESATGEDVVLFSPGRWTLGFHKSGATPVGVDPEIRIALSEDAFGHSGFGGSMAFADPGCDLAFAYVMNQMAGDMGLGPTGQSLVDATYSSIGYHLSKYGERWVR
jgi:CubicO group peptidase (beta-lactamase class C family)